MEHRHISSITDEEIDEIASIIINKPIKCFDTYRVENNENIEEYVSTTWKKEPLEWEPDTIIRMGMTLMETDDGLQIHHNWNYETNKGIGCTDQPLHNFSKVALYLLSKGFWIFDNQPSVEISKL